MAEDAADEGADDRPGTEVVDLCRDLIRMDTTNFGDDSGPGERKAAEYVAGLLEEVGIEARLHESHPGRTSVLAHWGGQEGEGLLLHGHLDVVPAEASDWKLDPFSGEIEDGYLWGRGAVDMKDFDAMLLTVVRQRQREGRGAGRPATPWFSAGWGGRGPPGPAARGNEGAQAGPGGTARPRGGGGG